MFSNEKINNQVSKSCLTAATEPCLTHSPGARVSGARRGSEDLDQVINNNIDKKFLGGNGTAAPFVLPSNQGSNPQNKLRLLLNAVSHTLRVEGLSIDDGKFLYKGLKCWLEIFQHYGFDYSMHPVSSMHRSVLTTIRLAVSWVKSGFSLMDYAKYKIAAFFSAWMDQEIPSARGEDPKPGVLFGGVFYSWIRSHMRDPKWRDSFSVTILSSKKGWPHVSDEVVKAKVDDHVSIMTSEKEQCVFNYTPPPRVVILEPDNPDTNGLELEMPSITFTKPTLERSIARRVREIASRMPKFSLDILTTPVLPSLSSNYNNTCAKQGTWGLFDKECLPVIPDLEPTTVNLEGVGWSSMYFGSARIEDESEAEEYRGHILGCSVNTDKFDEVYRKWYWNRYREALQERPMVKVIGLKEALKVRCISKGPPRKYFCLKSIQKYLWRGLQNYNCFELTGTPITEELMNTKFGGKPPGTRFHSGDYKAATDELMSWASEVACAEFIKIWEKQSGINLDSLKLLMLQSLTGHIYDHNGEEKEQKRGQLMGSIMSFPILCIANVSLISCAYELAHYETVRLDDLPCWINGDDCLTAYTAPTFPALWEGLGSVMGFTKSVGKTYDSETLASINSRFYRLDTFTTLWKEIPFINMGLLYGKQRSQIGKETESSVYDLGQNFREMMELAGNLNPRMGGYNRLGERLRDSFMYKNRNLMKTFQGPWHLPYHLCGLDLYYKDPTSHEMRTVSKLLRRYGLGDRVPGRMCDNEFKLERRIRNLIKEYCPLVGDRYYKRYVREGEFGKAYVSLAYRSWYCHGLDGLSSVGQSKGITQKYAEKLWRTVCQDSTYAKEAHIEVLTTEGIETILPLVQTK